MFDKSRSPGLTREELERHYDRYALRILRYCTAFLRDADAGRDAMQETFVRMARHGQGFREADNPEAWLLCIARNCCCDRVRARKRQLATEQALGALPACEPEDPMHELRSVLARLAGHPKVTPRDLLLMRLLSESWRTIEIADRLGISAQAVNKRKRRLAQLILETEHDDESDASNVH